MDAEEPPQGSQALRHEADAHLGRRPHRHRLRQHQVLRPLHREAGDRPGKSFPTTSRPPTSGSASPRPSVSASSPASPPSTSPRWSTTRSARTSRRRASSSWTPTRRCASTPRFFKEYFGTVIPSGDNKFAALNTAVWSGGSFVYVPPGVHVEIPLQAYFRINTENMGQFERTLIIADEGSLRALHRGLHGADLQERLAALGGRRDHRQEERPRSLHDDPELVEQRLQPGHQARDRARGRDHGVDRRQHRLQGDDEVPLDLPGRRARQGRDPLGRVRRARASTRMPAPR